MIDITHRVRELVTASTVSSGIVVVFVPHTTAAVTINENADPDVKHDLLAKFEALIPQEEAFYRHSESCFAFLIHHRVHPNYRGK